MVKFLTLMILICHAALFCQHERSPIVILTPQQIQVDGQTSDWQGIPFQKVNQKHNLWMTNTFKTDDWSGPQDLSFSWQGAYQKNRIYFLIRVNDDVRSAFNQEKSYQNDCVELFVDLKNRGGKFNRNIEDPQKASWEIHFLPADTPKVWIDRRDRYPTCQPQNEIFCNQWDGSIITRQTKNGYLIEAGFSFPNFKLAPGDTIGIEIAVGDDDGNGRESFMCWTGSQGFFWRVTDGYGKMVLKE